MLHRVISEVLEALMIMKVSWDINKLKINFCAFY